MTESLAEEVAALRREVQRLSDLEEIRNLIAHYGPAVDRGDSQSAAEMWTPDGIYDLGPDWPPIVGRKAIYDVMEGEGHQGLIHGGCAHFLSSPAIELDGDKAIAVCHSALVRRAGDGFEVYRLSANHIRLARTDEGWRVVERKNLLLTGDAAARALLKP